MSKRKHKTPAGANLAPDFEAAITVQQLQDSEQAESGNGKWAIARRVTMVVLTRSAAELQAAWDKPDVHDSMYEAVRAATEWREHLKLGVALADAAVARLLLTGQAAAEAQP